jgi:hypothetical protein
MPQETARLYTIGWLTFVAFNGALALMRRRELALFQGSYLRFLCRPWKLVIFGVAAIGFMLIAPYTGDPTWDWVDAGFMSALTFLTAPWVVGVLVRITRRQLSAWQASPAVALWLLSASWLYDVYVWNRDDLYPPTWASNLVASSVLYACAGLLWSLDLNPSGKVTFAFLQAAWLNGPSVRTSRVLWLWAAGFVVFVVAMMSPFLIELYERLH